MQIKQIFWFGEVLIDMGIVFHPVAHTAHKINLYVPYSSAGKKHSSLIPKILYLVFATIL